MPQVRFIRLSPSRMTKGAVFQGSRPLPIIIREDTATAYFHFFRVVPALAAQPRSDRDLTLGGHGFALILAIQFRSRHVYPGASLFQGFQAFRQRSAGEQPFLHRREP